MGSMRTAKHINGTVCLGLVLAAAAVGGAGQLWVLGVPWSFQGSRVGELVAVSLEAAVVEEVLFRGLVLFGLLEAAGRFGWRHPAAAALWGSSLLFGVLHMLPAPGVGMPEVSGIVAAQALLKVAQATAFGLVAGALVLESPRRAAAGWRRWLSLGAPLALHFAFDLLYWAPSLLAGIPLPDTYLTGRPVDLVVLGATTLLLSLAFAALRWSHPVSRTRSFKKFQ